MEAKELLEAGLTENQARVYLELLEHPRQSGGKIAKSLSIDRSFVYGIINSLIDKGLVSYLMKGNVRLYHPADPENLLKEIEDKKNKVSKIVKELRSLKKQTKSEKSVLVYEGKAGLKTYVRDLLESDSILTLGGGGDLSILKSLRYEYPHYLKELNKKQIKGKLITSSKNKEIMGKMLKNSKVKIKILEGLESKVSFAIFKKKLVIYSAEEKPFVIIIEDKDISNSLLNYFKILWEIAKP